MSEPIQPPMGEAPRYQAPASARARAALFVGLGSLLCSLAGPCALFFGFSALTEINSAPGKVGGKGLAITGIVLGTISTVMLVFVLPLTLFAVLIPAIQASREAMRQSDSSGHLKQIAVGMHNYHDVYRAIPMTGSPDPMLGVNMSWRVRLLPYIEYMRLHDQIDYSKSWDRPPNDQLHAQMPRTYGQPGNETERRKTQYLVFTHDGAIGGAAIAPQLGPARTWFQPTNRRDFADCKDGTANTIMAVEGDPERAVPWMKPADLALDPRNPKAGVGNYRRGGFLAVMADGSLRFISNKIDDETMLKLILCDEGMAVDVEALDPRNPRR
jgi:hypothetical protein